MSALAKSEAAELQERVRPLFLEAKKLYAKILAGEKGMMKRRDVLCMRSWQLGKVLVGMKEEIGYGKWLFWLGANWPDFHVRNAQRCMLLFSENPKAKIFSHLSSDSIRKFMFGYVPAKERPQLPGDRPIAPAPHQLTFVNSFFKFDQRIRAGLDPAPAVDVLRRDLEPVIRRIAELAGPDWIRSVVA